MKICTPLTAAQNGKCLRVEPRELPQEVHKIVVKWRIHCLLRHNQNNSKQRLLLFFANLFSTDARPIDLDGCLEGLARTVYDKFNMLSNTWAFKKRYQRELSKHFLRSKDSRRKMEDIWDEFLGLCPRTVICRGREVKIPLETFPKRVKQAMGVIEDLLSNIIRLGFKGVETKKFFVLNLSFVPDGFFAFNKKRIHCCSWQPSIVFTDGIRLSQSM